MKINKLKTLFICSILLLGLGSIAVPQAMAGASVLASYKLPFGLQFGKAISEAAKFQFDSQDRWIASVHTEKDQKTYKRGKTLGAQTRGGKLVSLLFFSKPPKVMRSLLTWGMSAEALKQLLHRQGGKAITYIKSRSLSEYSNGFITAVFGHYLYAFSVESYKGEKTGLKTMEISEYLDDDY